MGFKFKKLEVWRLAMEYIDITYEIVEGLPRSEEYNLKSQMVRAATSVALNIAEGSTGQTDAEQARFLGMALRSLVETVACQHLTHRRAYLNNSEHLGGEEDRSNVPLLDKAYTQAETLAAKLQAFRKAIAPGQLREQAADYVVDN